MSELSKEVTLAQMLQAREDRVHLQHQMLQSYRCPLICFTMNIAGPVKVSALIQRGFEVGLAALDAQLKENFVKKRCIDISATGCQALYAVNMEASALKQICVAIEGNSPLGRLFDMDVIDTNGIKLERTDLRGCIVCGAPGRACAAGRIHTVAQLQEVTTGILLEHFEEAYRLEIAEAAVQSLIEEVYTTPKPGLVDRRNNGSHTDMDVSLFAASAYALKSYFHECVKIGQNTATLQPQSTFLLLRQVGIEAESTMYRVTGGVNTHKGAIYTIGLLCGSLGRLWDPETSMPPTSKILSECSKIVRQSVESDFASADGCTAGLKLYRLHGLKGIRGEAAAGLPAVANISLPVYQNGLKKGLSSNDAGAIALLHLISHVEDTNLYHRGGRDGALWAAKSARALLESNPTAKQIEELDDAFIARNLSPGGCADLLAVTYFLHRLNP